MRDGKYLREIQKIVETGLCHRCGSCSGICPEGVITPGENYYPAWTHNADRCIECGMCTAVCPGYEFSFPEYRQNLFGIQREPPPGGPFLKIFLGYATSQEIRNQSTSGGIATQIPLFLLKTRKIKGAIVVKTDPSNPWKPSATVARTENEIKEAMGSKYPACSLNHLFRELRGDRGPFVVVGLPCHIHGLHKMITLMPSLEDKIALMIGLFCHSCLEHDAILDMINYYHIDTSSIKLTYYRRNKLFGSPIVVLKNGNVAGMPFPWLNIESAWRPSAAEFLDLFFRLYSPLRCRMCIDGLAEFADISIGDPWIQNWVSIHPELNRGYNCVIARTVKGLKVLDEAEEAGEIVLNEYTPADSSKSPACPQMVPKKIARGMYYIERRMKKGLPYPGYSFHILMDKWQKFKTALHVATYFAADRPHLRKLIARFLLSPAGILVFRFIFLRRRLKIYFWQKRHNTVSSIEGSNK